MEQTNSQIGQCRPNQNFIGFIFRIGGFNIHTEEATIEGTQLQMNLDEYTFKFTVHEDYSVTVEPTGPSELSDESIQQVFNKVFESELIESELGSRIVEGFTFKSCDKLNGEYQEMFLAAEHDYGSPFDGLSSLFGGIGGEQEEGGDVDPSQMGMFAELMKMFSQGMENDPKSEDESEEIIQKKTETEVKES